jgi:hypothetical protein
MIPLKEKAEIRVEYGDENFFPSLYHSGAGISPLLLTRPTTTCKARDRRSQQVETAAASRWKPTVADHLNSGERSLPACSCRQLAGDT